MAILQDFGMLLYGILKSFISLGETLLIIYCFFYFVIRIILLGNKKTDYKTFRKYLNSAVNNWVQAIYEASCVHLDSTKLWAEAKIQHNNDIRRSRVHR